MTDEDLKFGTIVSIEDDLWAHCDFPSVGNKVEETIRAAFEPIDPRQLKGWKLDIVVVYKRARDIYFGKRGVSVPSDKTKEFFLRLAVPTLEQAPYGFNKKKFQYDAVNEKMFFVIPPNFENYDTLEAYFIDSARRAVDEVLRHGIPFNGEKLKLQAKS